jgi:mannose-6-phosphate isomerase
MKTFGVMKNAIQEYAWGSYTAISELLGLTPPGRPQAELWMGTHPRGPSMVDIQGKWTPLSDVIENHPAAVLGQTVVERFGNQLPFLFKVLAAETPLSIQAHPDINQAKAGFRRENIQKIPLNAPERNYKDPSHKPECICALTPFYALKGFSRVSDIVSRMKQICPKGLEAELEILSKAKGTKGLKSFFHRFMTLAPDRKKQIIKEAVARAEALMHGNPVFEWVVKLYQFYPDDIGIFSPVLLNLVCLKPGEALYIPAGELHAYLNGVGLELMANSDNVLRGGLTPKHIDVSELLSILDFEERPVDIFHAEKILETEKAYPNFADEFVLSVVSVKKGLFHKSPAGRGVEILLCTDGRATLDNHDTGIDINKGMSVIIPAAAGSYNIKGHATFYKASVPI